MACAFRKQVKLLREEKEREDLALEKKIYEFPLKKENVGLLTHDGEKKNVL